MRYTIKMFMVTFFLFGCNDNNTSLTEACMALDGFCEQTIKLDPNCRQQRKVAILGAHKLNSDVGNDKSESQYQQLLNLEELIKCSELQTFIEYIPVNIKFGPDLQMSNGDYSDDIKRRIQVYSASTTERKHDKRLTYDVSLFSLEKLSIATSESKNPRLLYWHWSRNKDEHAVQLLASLFESDSITEYDVLYALSLYYSKRDKKKSVELMLTSLEHYPEKLYSQGDSSVHTLYFRGASKEALHLTIFKGLTQLYFKLGRYDLAYVFGTLLELNNDNSSDNKMIVSLMSWNEKNNLKYLREIAEMIDEAIADGTFSHQSLLSSFGTHNG
jgi:hypothetical protein